MLEYFRVHTRGGTIGRNIYRKFLFHRKKGLAVVNATLLTVCQDQLSLLHELY